MPNMNIVMDGDGALADIPRDKIIHVRNIEMMTRLPGGMASGASSVGILIALPDGRYVFAETSLAILNTAVHAFTGADQRDMDAAGAGNLDPAKKN